MSKVYAEEVMKKVTAILVGLSLFFGGPLTIDF